MKILKTSLPAKIDYAGRAAIRSLARDSPT